MKSRYALMVAALVAICSGAAAGEWQKSADLGLMFSQSGYSGSWAGSELGTVVWTFSGDVAAQKDLGASTNWKNTLKLTYGQTHQERETAAGKTWASPLKSTDRIFLESLLRFGVERPITPYVAFAAETQFHDADKHPLTPALLTESAGFGRQLVKNETTDLTTRVGLGVRQRTAYRIATVQDAGLEWVSDLTHTFNPQLNVVSKLRVFQAVTSNLDASYGDDWQGTDAALETKFSAQVSKYIQTTLFLEWLYDREISDRGRWREIFGFGVTYKLF